MAASQSWRCCICPRNLIVTRRTWTCTDFRSDSWRAIRADWSLRHHTSVDGTSWDGPPVCSFPAGKKKDRAARLLLRLRAAPELRHLFRADLTNFCWTFAQFCFYWNQRCSAPLLTLKSVITSTLRHTQGSPDGPRQGIIGWHFVGGWESVLPTGDSWTTSHSGKRYLGLMIPPDSITWSGGLGLGNTSCRGALNKSATRLKGKGGGRG